MLGAGLSTAPKAPRAPKTPKMPLKRTRSSGEKGTSKRGKAETSSGSDLPDDYVDGRRTPGMDEDDENTRPDPTIDCEVVVIHAGTCAPLICVCARRRNLG